MGLKFYKKVAYGSKLKVTKFGRVINIFRESTRKNWYGWLLLEVVLSRKKYYLTR